MRTSVTKKKCFCSLTPRRVSLLRRVFNYVLRTDNCGDGHNKLCPTRSALDTYFRFSGKLMKDNS